MKIYFSDFFEVSPQSIESYGAFNISLLNDLPLFIDPFLLFNSDKDEYKNLHSEIVNYVIHLKNISNKDLEIGLVKSLFTFPEVKQNYFGYSKNGNKGSGLGNKFATALKSNLGTIFNNFGQEKVSSSSHLEKLCLVKTGIGRDNISDFVTNIIKKYLLEYTQQFAVDNINPKFLKQFKVAKVSFNPVTNYWLHGVYTLPVFQRDFVLLTPKDMLTKDDTWINRQDVLVLLDDILSAMPNDQLRAHINQYFGDMLPNKNDPTKKDEQEALTRTIKRYPEILDYYIWLKEKSGHQASLLSTEKVNITEQIFVTQLSELVAALKRTSFYEEPEGSFNEAKKKVLFLKHVIEDCDGYRVFYAKGKPLQREADLQILFKLTWDASLYDHNAEVNNGRGPADFIVSRGSQDKTIVEFKLASNAKLKQNIQNQVDVYKKASSAKKSISVILYFSDEQLLRVNNIFKELRIETLETVILIDARNNKISASNLK